MPIELFFGVERRAPARRFSVALRARASGTAEREAP